MRKSHMIPTLSLFLLVFAFSNVQASFTQVKNFETIIITTSETCYLDMNDYFQGNITSFTATSPLSISPSKFALTYTASKFLYTPSNQVVSIKATKDIFGNWIPNSNWYLLDSNFNLHFYNYAPQNLSWIKDYTFISGDTSKYQCGDMIVINQALYISCTVSINSLQFKPSYFKTPLPTPTQGTPFFQERATQDSTLRNLLRFPDVNDTLITYTKCDLQVGYNVDSFANLWNLTTTPVNNLLAFSPQFFDTSNSFCIQDAAVINKTLFFADFSGIVYCVVDPLGAAQKYNLTIRDSILKMTVTNNNYMGQMTTTIVLQSKTSIYYFDWTDLNKPIPKNKYSIPQTSTMNLKYLDINQDFISTLVDSGSDGYNFYSYYLKQNLPGDMYYTQNFPYSIDFIDSSRPQNLFALFTKNPTDFSISANFSQLVRSMLQVNSTTTGSSSPTLSVNGGSPVPIAVTIIDQISAKVYLQSSGQNFGLTVPGQSTFDITGLLNGPLLSYQPNNTAYTVLPLFSNITINQNMTMNFSNQYTFYSEKDSDAIYYFSDASDGISLYTCTGPDYSNCADPESVATGTVKSMSATSQYLFTTDGAKINAIEYTKEKFPSIALTLSPSTVTLSCNKLIASQSPLAPYLFCQGSSSIYVVQLLDKKTGNLFSWGAGYINDWTKIEMQVSSNFPSLVFVQNATTIFLVDAFAVALGDPNTIVSTIQVPGLDPSGFNFSMGGQSLLVLRGADLSFLEYDISHPSSPVLVKTVLSSFHIVFQFLSDSQNSENIYIYAAPMASQKPVALVYKPGMTGNSNYWTQLPLSEDLFDTGNPNFVPPRFPGIRKSDYEVFLLPNGGQLGWIVQSTVKVEYTTTGLADSDATDYQETSEVLFTGVFETSTAPGQVAVNLILTDESVKAIQSIYYDKSIKLGSGLNALTVDPRVCFNGTIDQYTVAAQKDEDSSAVTLVNQYTPGASFDLTGGAYQLVIVSGTLVAQQEGGLKFFFSANNTEVLQFTFSTKNKVICDQIQYNSGLNMILSVCHDEKAGQYYFVFTEYTTSGTPPYSIISAKSAGQSLTNVRKVVFGYAYIFVLETIEEIGDFIHLYSYTSPNVLKYSTSMTSADLNANTFSVSDFVLNYRGSTSESRLFLTDPNFGLRIVDMTYSDPPEFQNPQLINLDAPDNIDWSGVIVISEVSDLQSPIVLVVTSSNYKNFFMEYTPNQGITVHRTFVPISNSTDIIPCYADGDTFLLSAYSSGATYALIYSVSNVSSVANAQNFPLFSVQYSTPDATAKQGCSFTLDPNNANGQMLYVSTSGNISTYTVSPNITLNINGDIGSDYITVTAHSNGKTDSFQYYLVTPPDGGTNLLFVYIIVGVVALVIIVVLLCYCNMRYKRKKNRIEDYSHLEKEEDGLAN